jgi:hypothetical protein
MIETCEGESNFGILKQSQSYGRAILRVGGEGGISHPRLCAGAGERSKRTVYCTFPNTEFSYRAISMSQ